MTQEPKRDVMVASWSRGSSGHQKPPRPFWARRNFVTRTEHRYRRRVCTQGGETHAVAALTWNTSQRPPAQGTAAPPAQSTAPPRPKAQRTPSLRHSAPPPRHSAPRPHGSRTDVFFHQNTCFRHGKTMDREAGAGHLAKNGVWNHVGAMEEPVATLPAFTPVFFLFILGSTLQA